DVGHRGKEKRSQKAPNGGDTQHGSEQRRQDPQEGLDRKSYREPDCAEGTGADPDERFGVPDSRRPLSAHVSSPVSPARRAPCGRAHVWPGVRPALTRLRERSRSSSRWTSTDRGASTPRWTSTPRTLRTVTRTEGPIFIDSPGRR